MSASSVSSVASAVIDVPLGADQSHIASVVAGVLAWAKAQPPAEGLGHLRSWRDDREVCRSQIVSDQQAAGIEGPALDRLLGRSTTTRANRNRTKRRAETLGRNKYLADEVSSGRLTGDQLDAICEADHKTDGAACTDARLLADIAAGPADAARKTADEFVKAQQSAADLEQRRRRDQPSLRDAARCSDRARSAAG